MDAPLLEFVLEAPRFIDLILSHTLSFYQVFTVSGILKVRLKSLKGLDS